MFVQLDQLPPPLPAAVLSPSMLSLHPSIIPIIKNLPVAQTYKLAAKCDECQAVGHRRWDKVSTSGSKNVQIEGRSFC
jgi:hypothetical protein